MGGKVLFIALGLFPMGCKRKTHSMQNPTENPVKFWCIEGAL